MIPYENLSLTNKMFEEEYKIAFNKFVEKGWYILGEEVKSFEQEFASYVGTKYCIGLASGLDALIYGKSCEMDKICDFCKKHSLKLVEDCAQSHGAKFKGKMTGSFGDAGAFSFYPTKNLGALGDAGAICTDNEEIAEMARAWRNYGSEKHYHNKYTGINSRLDEIQAAFLRIKLQHIEEITEKKRKLAQMYLNGLDKNKFILPKVDSDYFDVYHIFEIRTEKRDELKQYLLDNGIKTEIHYPVAPKNQEGYKGILDMQETPLAEKIASTILSLPISFGTKEEDVKYIIDIMNKF